MNSTRVHLKDDDFDKLPTGYFRKLPDGSRDVAPYTDCQGITPAANLCSNVEDLAKFCMLQFRYKKSENNPVLKGSTLREMHRPHWVNPGWKSGWGLGFSVFPKGDYTLIRHAGWVAGFRTQVIMSPEEKFGVVVFVNVDDFSPYKIAIKAYDMLASKLKSAAALKAEPVVFDPTWEKFLGVYGDPWHWRLDAVKLNNKLYLYEYYYPPNNTPSDNLMDLEPVNENSFRMVGENGNGELVVFELDDKGKVERLSTG
jgi:CubicO group peptidase (beta-lactamase class C family)